jgi:hypothetical protein
MAVVRNAYNIFVRKVEGRRKPRRPRRRREDTHTVDPRETVFVDADWINLAQVW